MFKNVLLKRSATSFVKLRTTLKKHTIDTANDAFSVLLLMEYGLLQPFFKREPREINPHKKKQKHEGV